MIFRAWPPIGVAAMLLLGAVVGKGSTRLDDWFLRDVTGIYDYRLFLLFFSDWRLLLAIWIGSVVRTLWRRQWRAAAVVAVTPAVAILLVRTVKGLFDRERAGELTACWEPRSCVWRRWCPGACPRASN